MIDWWGWQYLLEVGNGLLAIVTGWLFIFLVYHIIKVGSMRRVWSWRAWPQLPQALQLATAFLAVSGATFLIAAVIWSARYRNGAYLVASGWDSIIISVGRIFSIAGFLCALRVATRPMTYQWPLIGAMACGAVYAGWSLLRLF